MGHLIVDGVFPFDEMTYKISKVSSPSEIESQPFIFPPNTLIFSMPRGPAFPIQSVLLPEQIERSQAFSVASVRLFLASRVKPDCHTAAATQCRY